MGSPRISSTSPYRRGNGGTINYKRLGIQRREAIPFRSLNHTWVSDLLKRYPGLNSGIAKPLKVTRNLACILENFNNRFETFLLDMEKYKPDPSSVYKVDEIG